MTAWSARGMYSRPVQTNTGIEYGHIHPEEGEVTRIRLFAAAVFCGAVVALMWAVAIAEAAPSVKEPP